MESSFNLLQGKTAIITGASKGIGRAIAVFFASNGANLFLISRNEDMLQELQKEIKDTYDVEVNVAAIDISDTTAIAEVFTIIRKSKIQIDILVNNAGIMEGAVLQMAQDEMIQRTFATNVFGMFEMSKRCSKIMLRKRQGSIINLTSIIGVEGSKGQSIYSSSKAAVIGFTKSLSKELASYNIRVNAVAPGFIETDMTKTYEQNIDSIAMGRIGKSDDVAKVIGFLASDLSNYVTGQVIGVDGGMVI